MAANAAAAKKKKSEMTKKFLADKYAQMKLDREAKAARRAQLEERMEQLGLDDSAKAAARAKLRKEEMADMREQRKRLSVKDFTVRGARTELDFCWYHL